MYKLLPEMRTQSMTSLFQQLGSLIELMATDTRQIAPDLKRDLFVTIGSFNNQPTSYEFHIRLTVFNKN